jgi:hypothetical protein
MISSGGSVGCVTSSVCTGSTLSFYLLPFYGKRFPSHDLEVTWTVGSLVARSHDRLYIRSLEFLDVPPSLHLQNSRQVLFYNVIPSLTELQ